MSSCIPFCLSSFTHFNDGNDFDGDIFNTWCATKCSMGTINQHKKHGAKWVDIGEGNMGQNGENGGTWGKVRENGEVKMGISQGTLYFGPFFLPHFSFPILPPPPQNFHHFSKQLCRAA